MVTAKGALLKALRRVAVGEEIDVNGKKHKIVEVVKYREGSDSWLNLVWHEVRGVERFAYDVDVALEIEGNKLTLWKETDTRPAVTDFPSISGIGIVASPKTIEYLEEKYRLKEHGSARTTSKSRGKTVLRDKVPYWVYEAKSGHKVEVKIWDEGVTFYYSDGELQASAVQV